MSDRLQLALEIAAEASLEIASAFATRHHALREKSPNDFATETDASVEGHLARRISTTFPGDRILGEEGGERASASDVEPSGFRWIIDPLDGTFNFIHGFPYIATSIAVEFEGEVVAGVIANPLTDEVFYAERGKGAWLTVDDDRPPHRLSVSSCHALSDALVASVLPASASGSFLRVLPKWTAVASRCASIRRTGAAALDLAHVAAGRLDGFFVMSLAAWDAAAGGLLVREAGGVVCDFDGGNRYLSTNEVIAGTAPVCAELVRVLGNRALA